MLSRCLIFPSVVILLLSLSAPLSIANVQNDWADTRAPGTIDARKIAMLDAGSSGVRAVDYCFLFDYGTGLFELFSQSKIQEEKKPLTTRQELSEEMKKQLFEMYETENCTGLVRHKHFFLGGTAGLRARQDSDKVIKRLKSTARNLKALGANYANNVRLLSGLEEAAFTWLAVNYISMRLSSPYDQYGIIELGGGSVQVAFRIPLDHGHDTFEEFVRPGVAVPEGSVNVYRFLKKSDEEIEVYGKSYLEYGLNSALARYKEANLDSPCTTTPGENADLVYQKCLQAMENLFDTPDKLFTSSTRKKWSQPLIPKTIYLNGYFYDRTVALGLPDRLNVSLIKEAAEHICSFSQEVLQQKFVEGQTHLFRGFVADKGAFEREPEKRGFSYSGMPREAKGKRICAELTYIAVLLEQLGFNDSHTLVAIKSLSFGEKNYQFGISWPLGYAVAYANDWLPEFQHRVETTALALRSAVYADWAAAQTNVTRH
ncbi:MAG: hypothetical protein ACR2PT_00805 [Endozoicomonas sp.]